MTTMGMEIFFFDERRPGANDDGSRQHIIGASAAFKAVWKIRR
jgi:hypothetical protein